MTGLDLIKRSVSMSKQQLFPLDRHLYKKNLTKNKPQKKKKKKKKTKNNKKNDPIEQRKMCDNKCRFNQFIGGKRAGIRHAAASTPKICNWNFEMLNKALTHRTDRDTNCKNDTLTEPQDIP